MKLVKTTVENYRRDLSNLVKELDFNWIMGGYEALVEARYVDELLGTSARHNPIFDDSLTTFSVKSKLDYYVPSSSYTAIFFDKSVVVGQIIVPAHE